MKKIFCIVACKFLFLGLSYAQYTIKGKVLNEQNEGIQGVTITIGKDKPVTGTDSLGNYSFTFSSTVLYLSFSHVGYQTAGIKINKETVPKIILLRNNDFLSETIVKAFEKNSAIKNIPASVSVLNKEALERYGNQSFVAAVNTVPGAKMDERSPGSYRLSIRGNLLRSTFGVRNVKVYWNGIPLTDANSNTYINELAFENIGKIEIIKGPAGSMYGAGTGGVVLLNSYTSPVSEKKVSFQLSGGSYGLFSSVLAYDQTGKKVNSSISYSHQQSDGYRVHTNLRRDDANYTGTFSVNKNRDLYANVFYSDLYYQTPGGLTAAEMLADPRQARPASGIFKSAEAQKAALYLKTLYAGFAQEYRISNKWNNTTGVYFANTNSKGPTIRNVEIKRETGAGLRSVTQYKNNFFTATFGGEFQYCFTNTSTYDNKLGVTDTLQYHDEINARLFNIFLQAEVKIPGNFTLSAGASYNNCFYGFSRLSQMPVSKQSGNYDPQLIPRLSVLKKIKNAVNLYAAVSKGFSPPSIDEIHAGDGNFNKQLNAETGTNYEAGLKSTIIKNKLWVDACYYIFSLNNTIVSRRDTAGADYFVNAGKTKQNGFEAGINYIPVNNNDHFINKIKCWISYTNLHAIFENYQQENLKYDGNDLTGSSPNVFVAGADIFTAPGLYANLTYSYTDKIPLNDANSFYAEPYNLLFVKAGYKTRINNTISTEIFFSAEKSFNSPYSLGNDLNATGNRFYNPSAPHSFTIGAKFRFNVK